MGPRPNRFSRMVPVAWRSASDCSTYQWANEQLGHVKRREVGRPCLAVRGAQGAARSSFGPAALRTLAGSERRRVASAEAAMARRQPVQFPLAFFGAYLSAHDETTADVATDLHR